MATTPPIRMRVVPEVDWSEIADGGVCETCQALVADLDKHAAWHGQVGRHVDQRIRGVERRVFDRVRALQEQAGGLIAEQAERITGLNEAFINTRNRQDERLEQQERGLSSVWPRLRGVEDELSTADYLRTQEDLSDALTERDAFLYAVASCDDCSIPGAGFATLCTQHSAMLLMARGEVHGQ